MKKLMADQISKRSYRQKVTPGQVWAEAHMAGIDPIKLAEKINESIEASERLENRANVTVQVTKKLLSEARAAGMDIGDQAVREKVLDGTKYLYTNQPKSLEEEAELIAKQLKEDVDFVKKVLLHKKAAERREKKIQGQVFETMLADGYRNKGNKK